MPCFFSDGRIRHGSPALIGCGERGAERRAEALESARRGPRGLGAACRDSPWRHTSGTSNRRRQKEPHPSEPVATDLILHIVLAPERRVSRVRCQPVPQLRGEPAHQWGLTCLRRTWLVCLAQRALCSLWAHGNPSPGVCTLGHQHCCARLPGGFELTAGVLEFVPLEVTRLYVPPTEEMDLDELDLNPRILAAVKKAKLKSVKEVLHFSGPDLQRLSGLSGPDVQYLMRTASSHLRGSSVFTALHLQQQPESFPAQHQRLSLGCPVLDGLLRGGLPLDGITELAGCSSAGKTQLALQLCLAVQLPRRYGGLEAGAIYICTEDAFPDKRLQQLMALQHLRTDVPGKVIRTIKFGDQIFVEHAADVDTLLECVSKKVPVLLSRGMARLVVIDSVAAPFRCEFGGPALVPRARCLQALGATLRRLSCAFGSPVLCINQPLE
ncbi:DNA repair protein XRCC3 isoform X3 [Manis javanica]|uniref:DNA repair protein XRCC3 isoform X3 n=1 Tax=Manis javanica TaxID=9974 RepID=UPI003C6D39C6